MIDFEDGVAHRKVAHAVFQHVVEDYAAAVERFVVHANRQHEMAELSFRHGFSPRHFFAGTERDVDVLAVKTPASVGQVGQRHVGVEKFERLSFVGCQRTVEYGKTAGLAELGLATGKIVAHAVCADGEPDTHRSSDEKG